MFPQIPLQMARRIHKIVCHMIRVKMPYSPSARSKRRLQPVWPDLGLPLSSTQDASRAAYSMLSKQQVGKKLHLFLPLVCFIFLQPAYAIRPPQRRTLGNLLLCQTSKTRGSKFRQDASLTCSVPYGARAMQAKCSLAGLTNNNATKPGHPSCKQRASLIMLLPNH